MKAIGIKALKNNLSRFIQMVREGEQIFVTDRDEVVAEIHRPTVPGLSSLSRWECFLNDEERQGKVLRRRRAQSSVMQHLKTAEAWPADLDDKSLIEDMRSDRI